MMKILFLIGSGRKKGNTAQVARLVESRLVQLAAQDGKELDREFIFLDSLRIEACRGCRVCFDQGEERCPAHDGFLVLKEKMRAADGLVIASPVYVDDASGLVKTWIDRLAHVCHRPEFAGKCALALATTGASPAGHTLGTLQTALATWGFHISGKAEFKMGALMAPDETRTRFTRRAARAADRLYHDIAGQAFTRPSIRSLLTFKIQQIAWQRYQGDDIDSAYWRKRGWLDPHCEFYIPHRSSRIKVLLARAAGSLLARVVL